MNLYLYLSSGEVCSFLAIIQSFLPVQHVSILSHTLPRSCNSHLCFHRVWFFFVSSFVILVCRDCHHLVLHHLYTFFKEKITALSLSSHVHFMERHILSGIFSYKEGKLHLHPYLYDHNTLSCLVFDPRLIFFVFSIVNNFVIIFVPQPSHLSSVCRVHDQISLPKKKTACTRSTTPSLGSLLLKIIMSFQKALLILACSKISET